MKIKCLFLTVLLLTVTTIGFAQANKTAVKATAATPEQVVKNLYAAQKVEKTNPFVQTKSRTLVDKYFTKSFADLIWKTNSSDTGWNADPLYNSQDPQITAFAVGKPKEDGADGVFLKVSFKSYGKPEWVGFNLRREANKTWKIDNIEYSDGDQLASMLRYSMDEDYRKEFDAGKEFEGDYMVGAMKCRADRTMGDLPLYRVTCEGREGVKLYAAEGTEKETAYIYTDDNGKQQDKFVFKAGEKNGKYFDAAGKEMNVKPTQ